MESGYPSFLIWFTGFFVCVVFVLAMCLLWSLIDTYLNKKRRLLIKKQTVYLFNKKIIDSLGRRACNRHDGDIYLWVHMDRSKSGLRTLKKEINGCGACSSRD